MLYVVDYFRLLFAYTRFMFKMPSHQRCDYTLRCKRCGENIPAPVETMPASWIIAECPLCGEKRRYLPNDIFRGTLSFHLTRKPARSVPR
jgi:rRNA maturation protein Nop10